MNSENRKYNFLILEDNPGDFLIVEELLYEQFVEPHIVLAKNFREATNILRSETLFDVILIDLSLPDKSGKELVSELLLLNLDSPIIILTGYSNLEFSLNSISEGIADYIIKDDLDGVMLHKSIVYAIKRNKASRSLALKEIRFKEVQEVANLGSWEIDLNTFVVKLSDECFRIMERRKTQDEVLTFHSLLEIVHPKDFLRVKENFEHSFLQPSINWLQYRIVAPNGIVKYIETRWKVYYNEQGKAIRAIGTLLNITERKKEEQEVLHKNAHLRNLTLYLQQVREEERSRISRDIHDELGQQFAAIKMDIDWVKYRYDNSDKTIVMRLEQMLDAANGLMNSLRRISYDLRPAIIDDLGLIAALEWRCSEFEKQSGIMCSFTSSVGERDFDAVFRINVYRILQEALTNIMKHANASEVRVELKEDLQQSTLLLEIFDNGKGISEDEINNATTFGIVCMKERVELFKGNLNISGSQNGGTFINIKLPIRYEHFNS